MLYVHRSERADHLVEALGDLLIDPLADPMEAEVVAVPTRGVERWVTQRLSHRLGAADGDGVCANLRFPFPGVLVGSATASACGFDEESDPWPPERSVWPLLELVDRHLGDAFLAPLEAHLRHSSPAGEVRRFGVVRHLADLYDRYAVHRPDLVRAWLDGGDWAGRSDPQRAWQAQLWVMLRDRIGVPSPAERFETAWARLADEPGLVELPERLSLFGLTRLPASHLRVLEAVAVRRDVHLFLLHPSAALWDAVAGRDPDRVVMARAGDPTTDLASHPLLRSWGRDAREMQLVLRAHGVADGEHRPVADRPDTLLGRLQADIRADRRPPGWHPPADGADPRPVLSPDDDSLRVHACHGRARQVEVVRDAVLHLLAADPGLEPRDVVVMCPDIEAFAPLVHAAFGAGARGDGPDEAPSGPPALRVRLADRSLRQTNPLLAVAAHLLELADSRVTASEVLDLASRQPVGRRFQLDEEDLARAERWVGGTGVRWGLDAEHRAAWQLERVDANTWAAGLDRLLLGVAMTEEGQRLVADVLPYDDVSGTEVDLAGRLAELVSRLGRALDRLSSAQTVSSWAEALAEATESVAAAAPADAWQHEQLHRVLAEAVREATAGASGRAAGPGGSALSLAEARELLGERLRGRPTRANFRTGDLTICTLVPMRSVPHRVVCLLGLDDGVFPRHPELDGDDLLAAEPRVGDRDGRSEDRQLLLDAVLAATEHLVITYSGRDERTNQERPPAVPVAELLDVIDATVRSPEPGRRARQDVMVRHPLQSFDPRNFGAPEGPGRGGPWSFDPVNLDGALALSRPPAPARPFLAGRLPDRVQPVIELESLVRFVEHPVKSFLRERLGLYLNGSVDRLHDELPVEPDPLEKWGIGDRILEARLSGAALDRALAAERGRGLLPPGALADQVLEEIVPCVESLVAAFEALPCAKAEPRSLEVNVTLPDGRSLVGTVPGVRDGVVLRCVYSRLAAKHRLAAWVRFLALSAGRPELAAGAHTLGRGHRRRDGTYAVGSAELGSFGGDDGRRAGSALAALAVVVDLYDRGMREPLPLYCDTSAAWAEAAAGAKEPMEEAGRCWRSNYDGFKGEDSDPEHELVLGPARPLSSLTAEAPLPDEAGPGWPEDERTRLGRLARRLWDPLLAHERAG
ncbi:MAG TPA: exodeoxyribonuclease V subunit gamma [Acidimicrobiales bacterium]|nr:exodeoxyribonuclease V subunit gamma [Acidimicrobiales bacterium]